MSGRCIAVVANEPSGDQLGALLIRALREREPALTFVGVAGPRMQAEGCRSLLPLERLSVMGLVEVLRVLPDLLRARRELVAQLSALRPAAVVGVDAPDFNLGLERRLRAAGIPAAHLVSPTVWAWRPGRVEQIRRSVDLMLSIFPFEAEFLARHRVPVRYIGHPLADDIPLAVDRTEARRCLGLAPGPGDTATEPMIALLPGSRRSEVELLADAMLLTAAWCHRRRPQLRFVAPMASPALYRQVDRRRRALVPQLPITLVQGRSREAMAAADVVLTASGTATLEALLLKRPMVVAYRLNPVTYGLVKTLRLIKVRHVAMANLLAGEGLAPEFLQHRCRPELLGPALLALLDDPQRRAALEARYAGIHAELRRDAARCAAEAVLGLAARRPGGDDA
ncbi:MAG: lipid-A-disaccharide synthase [Alphaproteobacteria bacterium]|nr:lipid-A-disaccharide synthase [Alphaproteobacteria bacterium]